MSDMAISSVFRAGLRPNATLTQRQEALREVVSEVVGITFFAQMLKIAHNSALKGEFGHGGRGEQVFRGQLDMELARRVGRATRSGLSEALYQRFVGQLQGD